MSSIRPLPDEVVAIKRDSLSRMLLELSDHYIDDNLQFERYASRMSEAYSQEYRQLYSELFPILMRISGGDADDLQLEIVSILAISACFQSELKSRHPVSIRSDTMMQAVESPTDSVG